MNGFWRKKTWLFLPTWLPQLYTPSPPWSLWGWMPPTSGPTSWWSCTTSAPPSLSQTFSLLKSLPNFWCLIHWRTAALCFLWILFHHPICVHDCSLHYLLNPLWVLKRCVFLRFHLLSLVHLLVPVLFIFFPHRPFIELKNNVVNCEIYISLQIFAILSGFCPTVYPLAKSDVTGDICFYIIEISRGPRPLDNNVPLDITLHKTICCPYPYPINHPYSWIDSGKSTKITLSSGAGRDAHTFSKCLYSAWNDCFRKKVFFSRYIHF